MNRSATQPEKEERLEDASLDPRAGAAEERPDGLHAPRAPVSPSGRTRLGTSPLERHAHWIVLGGAMTIAAALILWLNRDATFFIDELAWVMASPGADATDALTPHYGHLILTSRIVYRAILESFGAGYVPFRLLGAAAVLLSAGLFYLLAKRRVGPWVALAPTLLLLFLGSAWKHVLVPNGFTVIGSVAIGLGALLAIERRDRRGDIVACALLCLSIATYTAGLPFLAAVATSVLLRPDRRKRAWIFVVPLVLYTTWWFWALGQGQSAASQTNPSNILLAPAWIADSLAVVLAALTGLAYDFDSSAVTLRPDWGGPLALVAVGALAWRISRGRVPTALWVMLAIPLTYWTLGALTAGVLDRFPFNTRYIYPGAVGVLLTAVVAVEGIRVARPVVAVLAGLAALGLATNFALLRDASARYVGQYSDGARGQLTAVELAREHVDPQFDPSAAGGETEWLDSAWDAVRSTGREPTRAYLEAVERYGSPAFSASELRRQSEPVRREADLVLASALDLELRPDRRVTRGTRCRSYPASDTAVELTLPGRGAHVRAGGALPSEVRLRRFAGRSFPVRLGTLAPGRTALVSSPSTRPSGRWKMRFDQGVSVKVCRRR